jgi:hypothetical protein
MCASPSVRRPEFHHGSAEQPEQFIGHRDHRFPEALRVTVCRQVHRKPFAATPDLDAQDPEGRPETCTSTSTMAYRRLLLTMRRFAIVNVTCSVSVSSATGQLFGSRKLMVVCITAHCNDGSPNPAAIDEMSDGSQPPTNASH